MGKVLCRPYYISSFFTYPPHDLLIPALEARLLWCAASMFVWELSQTWQYLFVCRHLDMILGFQFPGATCEIRWPSKLNRHVTHRPAPRGD